jgi:hypothetical protein
VYTPSLMHALKQTNPRLSNKLPHFCNVAMASPPPLSSPDSTTSEGNDIVLRHSAVAAANATRAFDALEISLRAALPTSTLTSDALSTVVASLHSLHASAASAAVPSLARAVSDACVFADADRAPGHHDDDAKLVAEEEELDVKLQTARVRLRNVRAADKALAEAGVAAMGVRDVMKELADRMEAGQDLGVGEDGLRGELNGVSHALDAVRKLLEDRGMGADDVPLLGRVAKAMADAMADGPRTRPPTGGEMSAPSELQATANMNATALEDLSKRLTTPSL